MAEERPLYHQTRFAPPPGSSELLLVRHGASAPADPAEPFPDKDGHADPPLAPEGRAQAELLAERLAGQRIDAIYVTSLRRTRETAAPLASRIGLELIEEPDLREVHLGEWEGGLFRQKAAESHPTFVQMVEEERWDVIPDAESLDALSARVVPAVNRIAASHVDERVVVVAHGGVIGTILAHASNSSPFAFVASENTSISHLVVHEERWLVRRFNDTVHLDGEFS